MLQNGIKNFGFQGQKPPVHFKDVISLNNDGTVHYAHKGTPYPTSKIVEWLNGWKAGN